MKRSAFALGCLAFALVAALFCGCTTEHYMTDARHPEVALTMDGGLSAAADSRCESFVAGGPFDHSGMTTRSEICAAGPLGSASAVCTGWQGSPAHYANIMEPSFTSMGVGCWFCQTAEGQYTYWVVTFN